MGTVNGVEVCADDASGLPADGRVIVTNEQGGYVAADGDASNGAPLDGYLPGPSPHLPPAVSFAARARAFRIGRLREIP